MGGRLALLIGTGSFRDGSLPALETAPANVRDLAALLRDPYIAGFDPVIDLVNASTQQVGREIAHILERRHRDDLLLLYYTGHALFDDEGELHLAMHDTELDLLGTTSISASFVAAEMDRSRSKRQLLVLDCRFGSGLAHGTKGAPESRSSPPPSAIAVPDSQRLASAFHVDGRGRVIFAGCDDPGRHSTVPGFRRSQVPGDPSESENSPFTYHLIEGLRGAGDLDRDGRITVGELYDYTFQQIAQRTGTLLPTKRGEELPGVPVAYATRRPSVAPAAPSSSRPPHLGALISDRYLTLSVLDDSGLGIVFSARDERTGRPVTVRILRPPGSTDASTLERFMREAQVASAIDHPNVVRILELGFEGRTAFIVMEPLDGESLGALLQRKTRLSITEALDILLPAMAAVTAAHQMHVLHRDLNPDNIFVNRDPNGSISSIKVLGFGMSTMLDEATGVPLGRGIRSPHYLSPEQLFGQGQPDLRADVYAFGVILYEALTGTQPFAADNHAAALFKIGAGHVEPPSSVCPDLPHAIDAIVDNAMALEPAQRYPDVETMRYALQNAAATHGWLTNYDSAAPPHPSSRAAAPPEVMIQTPAVFERRRKRSLVPQAPRSWVMGVGLLAAAGGAAGWFLTGPFTEEPTRASSATMQTAQPQAAEAHTPAIAPAPAAAIAQPAPAGQPEVGRPSADPLANTTTPTTANVPPEPATEKKPLEAAIAQPPGKPEPETATPTETAAESPIDQALATDKPEHSERAERKVPMPANLAAFLNDAGVPIDSVTPREARAMLIRSRTEARVRARAEKRAAREARNQDGAVRSRATDDGQAANASGASKAGE